MAGGLAHLKVLVIDDNAQMRTIVGTVLGGAGVGMVHYAADAREGLDVAARTHPDVVYVDYEMPMMNGLDFLTSIRDADSFNRYVPVVMFTAYADLPRLSEARDRGVTEFLGKPVTARDILRRLNFVINYPRPFVASPRYFGPDRRRNEAGYKGPRRRAADQAVFV